ncbi:hypothetical protein [Acinetobacter indicus]|uniref:hypothetical protein n=2 Tax=Acinetobacter TaxID=469 RepID=UPI000CECA4A2|nr:hypothetical protein [Acinetobacter indicus]
MINLKDGADPVMVTSNLAQVDKQIGFMGATLKRTLGSCKDCNIADTKLAAMLEASVYIAQKTLHIMEGTNPFIQSNLLSKSISAIYGVLFQLEESKRMDTDRNDLLDLLDGLLLITADVRATVANIHRLANGYEMEYAA